MGNENESEMPRPFSTGIVNEPPEIPPLEELLKDGYKATDPIDMSETEIDE